MTIRYSDGRAVQAALLAHTGETLRVAIQGDDDVTEFRRIGGVWVSEYCEPAKIEFAWEQPQNPRAAISEAECCWSSEHAASLMYSLMTAGGEHEDQSSFAVN